MARAPQANAGAESVAPACVRRPDPDGGGPLLAGRNRREVDLVGGDERPGKDPFPVPRRSIGAQARLETPWTPGRSVEAEGPLGVSGPVVASSRRVSGGTGIPGREPMPSSPSAFRDSGPLERDGQSKDDGLVSGPFPLQSTPLPMPAVSDRSLDAPSMQIEVRVWGRGSGGFSLPDGVREESRISGEERFGPPPPAPWASSVEGRWLDPSASHAAPVELALAWNPGDGQGVQGGSPHALKTSRGGPDSGAPAPTHPQEPVVVGGPKITAVPQEGAVTPVASVVIRETQAEIPKDIVGPTWPERALGVEVSRSVAESRSSGPAGIARLIGQEPFVSAGQGSLVSSESSHKLPENGGKPVFSADIPVPPPIGRNLAEPPAPPSGTTLAGRPLMVREQFQSAAPENPAPRLGSGRLSPECSETSVPGHRLDPLAGLLPSGMGDWVAPRVSEGRDANDTVQASAQRPAPRLADQLSGEVVLMQRLRTASMTAVLRPDAGSELRVDLRRRSGRIEIRATVERGDSQAIAEGWNDLQQRMASQGVHLLPLEREPSRPPAGDSLKSAAESAADAPGGNPAHSGGRGRNPLSARDPEAWGPGRGAPTETSPADPRSKSPAPHRPGHRRLLESWA